MRAVWLQRYRLAISLIVAGLMHRVAPSVLAQEGPAWFRLNGVPQVSAGLEVDESTESDRISGVTSTYDTLFLTPTVGLQTSGSIYHPNLLTFDFNGELGWGWNQMTTTSPGSSQSINENDELTRYLFDINLLEEKPYNASFFASQDHTYRDYGSFDTYAVDDTRYGGTINWSTRNFNLTSNFGYQDETDTGIIDSSEVKETYFNFLGIYKRHTGQTTLTGQWNQYDNILDFSSGVSSLTESLGIADSETFGSRQQITAATSVSVAHSIYSGQQLDTVNASENVNINHTRNLNSYLIMDAELNDLYPGTETFLQGSYGLRHQLYESLASTLDVHGDYQENTGDPGTSSTDLFGVGLTENYLKRLQSWGRLNIGASIVADHQDQNSSGGDFTSVGEAHQLYLPTSPQYHPVYLNQPNVIAGSVQVTSGGQLLVENTDYELVKSGELTEVRLIVPPSAHLQMLLGASDNLTVTVTYQSASANNASYESLASNLQIRLDLWGRLGIYGRLNWMDNNAPPIVIAQTLTDLTGGMDFHWRWFRTGAEYEDYDSNFSQYTAFRFFQDFDFQINSRSSFSTDFSETFYHYPTSGDQTTYQFITKYSVQLWSSVSWYVQGGYSMQNVLGSDQSQASAQTGLTWSRGKLSLRTGYEYNDQATSSGLLSEDLSKERVFCYLKRTF